MLKKLGCDVYTTDVRYVEDQVISVGGTFVHYDLENLRKAQTGSQAYAGVQGAEAQKQSNEMYSEDPNNRPPDKFLASGIRSQPGASRHRLSRSDGDVWCSWAERARLAPQPQGGACSSTPVCSCRQTAVPGASPSDWPAPRKRPSEWRNIGIGGFGRDDL